jgi:DNA-binding PadR family transcriptional regulator
MTEVTFLVLTALAGEPQHGYAVLEDVAQMTDGRVRLRAGTLYAALDRLRTDGLIEVDREEVVQSRLRRYYRLTAAGEQSLAAEAERLRAQTTIAEHRLTARRTGLGGAPA